MSELLQPRYPNVPQDQVEAILRQHLTVEDQRQDLFALYSEQHFSDHELDLIIAATHDPARAKALEQSPEGRQLSEKITRLMRESANDPAAKARASQRLQAIERELRERQGQAAPAA